MSQTRSIVMVGTCLLGSMMAAGCVQGDDDTSVVILFNTVPSVSDGACMVPTSEGGQYLARGLIDAAWPLGYQFFPLVKNYTSTGDLDTGEGMAQHILTLPLQMRKDPTLLSTPIKPTPLMSSSVQTEQQYLWHSERLQTLKM
jgi:hypothetical protein